VVDPATPTGWGPTEGELNDARGLVSTWTPAQLAGQVIVGRWYGTDPAVAASLVSDLNLAGVQLTGSNIVDEVQVRSVNQAVTLAFASTGRDFPPVIGVDQEGGTVAHLYGVTTDLPAFAEAGRAVGSGPNGAPAVRAAMAAAALELRGLGFTWVFAPVADVTIGDADPTIGSRSPSSDPEVAGATAAAAVLGYNDAGIVSTVKHFPGHGSATEDSHQTLPVLGSSLDELRARDLRPFEVSITAGAPAVMVGHLDVTALAPGVPSSLAPAAYGLLRDEYRFDGVAITDSLGMGGVMAWESPSVEALKAGADLLLMPADTRLAHAQVADAIAAGVVPRERAEEAAARVIALQRWQQRVGVATSVPPDASEQARARVQEMLGVGW
jgi:beta-N-acetylhexosaminidase